MPTTINAPVDLMEEVAHLCLPALADQQLQCLMDANTNGQLTDAQRQQLEELVDWSESISLIRARAWKLLDERPS